MSKLSFKHVLPLGILSLSSPVWAASYYVSPSGADDLCKRSQPCSLSTGVQLAMAGDEVVLLDGIYKESFSPSNSGTPDAWITFRADDCALPIIEGEGENAVPDTDGNFASGIYSSQGTYLRYIGIVSRYWDSGFSNGWTGDKADTSNGHIEYINCIADGNHRTGFAMYSASHFKVSQCISSHSGGSPTDSWSSGIQMYAVQGTADDNVVEQSVSFENMDAQKNNDGSGFIADESTTGASFINNIGFHNAGSCVRMTRSDNTRMLHFSCYHNGMNPAPNSPADPGEFYFTDDRSRATASLTNTLAAASGSSADPAVLMHPPETGVSNNLTVDSGAPSFFSDPEGTNPDFRPPASAASQLENLGTTAAAPQMDIGFDPRCIKKSVPSVPYQQSWWIYSIDYDYIRSIGGVVGCFHPKLRSGGPDLGAYELSGDPHLFSTPGTCMLSTDEGGNPNPGAQLGTGGDANSAATGSGGASSSGGAIGTGAAPSGTGSDSSGGEPSTTGVGAATGQNSGTNAASPTKVRGSCNLSSHSAPASSSSWLLVSLLGLGWLNRKRRSQN